MNDYRTDARTVEYIRALELVRETAAVFLYVLDTDPGFPFRRQEALRAALAAVPAAQSESVAEKP